MIGIASELRALVEHERARTLSLGERQLPVSPRTVTASVATRSRGGANDYYSEGDYWWPDPANPDGPYIRRDGRTNPQIFTAHREAMRDFCIAVPALVSAWRMTGEKRFAVRAVEHLHAWFVDAATRMNPHLRFGQAIHGITPGRGIGLVDTVHLAEVAVAIRHLADFQVFAVVRDQVVAWFSEFVDWMTTSQLGIDEREEANNHGTCWVLQVAAFALVADRSDLLGYCTTRFKTVLLERMDADGGFPLELARTKPYNYSLFNLDALAGICQLLSQRTENLWSFTTPGGGSMKSAIDFMAPYVQSKNSWPRRPDVEYFDEYPVRHPFLIFGASAFDRADLADVWKTLESDPTVPEVVRNFPIRQPVLWYKIP